MRSEIFGFSSSSGHDFLRGQCVGVPLQSKRTECSQEEFPLTYVRWKKESTDRENRK